MKAAQSYALIQDRDYVIPDDVKYLAVSTLAHRLIITAEAKMTNITGEQVITDVLSTVRIPVARKGLTSS